MARNALVAVVALVLLLTAVLTAEARFVVRMVQVVHRHGARGPFVDGNETQICGTEYQCGELTGVGIEMITSLGKYVRARYNNLSYVAEAFFPSTRYNSSVVYTRSTGTQRTIQSATAFLRGVFPEDYFYPVIYSSNSTTDSYYNTDAWPSVMGRRWLEMDVQNAALNQVVDAYLTFAQIQAAAKDAFSEGMCADFANRAYCVNVLYDIATSFEASGRLSSMPNLEAALPGLAEYMAAWYRYIYSYNASNALDLTQGSAAQNLAQIILANINAHRLSPSFKLYEFSTHDTMVAPLAITYGDQTETTMRPPFGITLIVELLQDTESTSDWYVRVLRGHPALLANGSYEFQLDSLQVNCMDAAGNQYVASTGVCPLDSFRRMVDSSRPSVANGQCTMAQNQYDNMGCPRTIADNAPVPHYCWIYRYVCSQSACPSGYILAAADFQCYPTGDADSSSSSSAATTTTTTTAAPPSPPQEAIALPAKWLPRTMNRTKGKRLALGLVQGVNGGVLMGAALQKQQQQQR